MMLKILAISVIPIFLFGCSRNWCYEKYPIPENNSISIVETLIVDTIYIPIPADTVSMRIAADCPDQENIYKHGKVEYKVIIKDKLLTITRISEADSLEFINNYKNTSEFKNLTRVKEVIVIKYKIPRWCYYCLGIAILLAGWVTRKVWLRFIKLPI